jgi:hypothetical protein
VVAVIWLGVIVVVAVVLLAALALASADSPRHGVDYQVKVALHGIRRRQEATQIKSEIRRDAAQARRELRAELDRLNGEP